MNEFAAAAFLPKRVAVFVCLGIAAFPAFAQVNKCKGSDGSPIYQEAPCADTSGKIGLQERTAGKSKSSEKTASDESAKKYMNDAFQSRMDKQDYDGALAVATTESQKSQARKKIAAKDAKCQALGVKMKEAQANFDKQGARAKSGLDKAKNEFGVQCR